MYAASLEALTNRLGFRVDRSKLPKQLSNSSVLGLRSAGVIDQIADFSEKLMHAQTILNEAGERGWAYPLGGTLAAGAKELVLRADKRPHAHQLLVVDNIIDEAKKIVYSCTLQSPCASGKTLLLLLLIAALSKKTSTRALIVVNSNVAAEQFVSTITSFFDLERDDILILDSDSLDVRDLYDPVHTIFIATYQLLSQKRRAANESALFFSLLFALPLFQIVGFDEAHCAPAQSYGEVAKRIKAPVLIAMSATLTRRDDRMVDLRRRLGTKAVVVDRCELVERGLLPRIERVDVLIDDAVGEDRSTLSARKISVFLTLLAKSVRSGKAVLVFFDTLAALAALHALLSDALPVLTASTASTASTEDSPLLPPLFGETSKEDRLQIIAAFRSKVERGLPVVLCLSRVGDTAFDIPADELYQPTVCDGSSITEFQRLGRISRGGTGKNYSFSFIAAGTSEEVHASLRGQETRKDGYLTRTLRSSDDFSSSLDVDEFKNRIAEAAKAAKAVESVESADSTTEHAASTEAAASAEASEKAPMLPAARPKKRKVAHTALKRKLRAAGKAGK